jgi:hypothetical protein
MELSSQTNSMMFQFGFKMYFFRACKIGIMGAAFGQTATGTEKVGVHNTDHLISLTSASTGFPPFAFGTLSFG